MRISAIRLIVNNFGGEHSVAGFRDRVAVFRWYDSFVAVLDGLISTTFFSWLDFGGSLFFLVDFRRRNFCGGYSGSRFQGRVFLSVGLSGLISEFSRLGFWWQNFIAGLSTVDFRRR